jgi:hypothetical protein
MMIGLIYYLFKTIQRYLDRGKQVSLHKVTKKKEITEENSDIAGSKLPTQKQLQKLYTGP